MLFRKLTIIHMLNSYHCKAIILVKYAKFEFVWYMKRKKNIC